MKLNSKKLILVSIFLIVSCLLAVSAVSAQDFQENGTDLTTESLDDVSDDVITQSDEDICQSEYENFSNAIENSVDGQTIELNEDINTTETFHIYNDITIDGKNHVIDGSKSTQIFHISSKVTLKNIIFKNGFYDRGSAIFNSGELTVDNCKFIDNVVKDNYYTGGGAIYSSGSAKISNSVFQNNVVDNTDVSSHDDVNDDQANGGAIYFAAGSNSLSGCEFINNKADNHGGSVFAYNEVSSLTITNCEFTGNKANFEDGGAISFTGKKLSISNSKFNNNYAYEDGGAIDTYSMYSYSVTVTITGCTFSSNSADKGAGVIWCGVKTKHTIKGSDFTSNKASVGGCLYMEKSSSASVSDCKFTKNSAVKSSTKSKSGETINPCGGAIYVVKGATAKISNSKFESNKAYYGAAIYNADTATTVTGSTFSKNSASDSGAVFNKGKITIKSSKFNSNTAKYGCGVFNDGTATIDSCEFKSNVASGSGAAVFNKKTLTLKSSKMISNKADFGGAVYNKGTASLSYNTIQKNKAKSGGALFQDSGKYTLTGNILSSNSASNAGGALYFKSGKISTKGNAFISNKAKYSNAVYSKKSISLNNNWWGAKKAKKAPSNPKMVNVKVKSWLYLKISSSPAKVAKGKKSTISVQFKTNKNKKMTTTAKIPLTFTAKSGSLSSNTAKISKGVAKVKYQKTASKKGKVTANALGVKVSVVIK